MAAETFTLPSFAEMIAEKLEVPKSKSLEACKEAFEAMASRLIEGDRVALHEFGIFSIAERGERQGRNPKTGESIVIPAKKAIKFKASKTLRDALNPVKGKKAKK